MTAEVPVMATGIFRLAPISFYPDLGARGAAAIPLGLFGEIVIPGRVRALGLIARTELTPTEYDLLDTIGRRMLVNPFVHLSEDFDAAWKEAPAGHALEFLGLRHRYSSRLGGVDMNELPRSLFVEGKPSIALVRGHLIKVLDDRGGEGLRPMAQFPAEQDLSTDTGTKEMTMPLAA